MRAYCLKYTSIPNQTVISGIVCMELKQSPVKKGLHKTIANVHKLS